MTRPPRPKYPNDSKNYHEMCKRRFVHTVCLPEDLLQTYEKLRPALRPSRSHADVIRCLFEAAEREIQALIQASQPHGIGSVAHHVLVMS
ncbi:hypothetical protein R1sor_006865 [Riccia sorocarpa]|uniref:Uncharacterized protein n=1 Tax=Riccia sorocarpa TaxID=122646 RepID=A0ABD3HV30_9MARC